MDRRGKILCVFAMALLLLTGLLLIRSYWKAQAQQQYKVLDTTREQFLGEEAGALGSTSALTFTSVSRLQGGDGEVGLLPLGVVGAWETLASPLLPYPIENAAAVAYVEPGSPFRRRIYLIGGANPIAGARLDTVHTCNVNSDGSLTDWVTQTNRLPRGLSSLAAAISTEDVYGNPITPTLYVVGGRYGGETSYRIYYAYVDPVTLNVGKWMTSSTALPLGSPRLGLSAVANDGYLYAIGGNDGGSTYSAAVWHFSLDENGVPFARTIDENLLGSSTDNPNGAYHQTILVPSASPSYLTDTLYVIGGRNSGGSTQRVLRGDIYPPGSAEAGSISAWQDISGDDLPAPLSGLAAALGDVQGAGRQVYVIGGAQGTDSGNPQKTIRSAVVNDQDNSFADWYGRSWMTSPALPAPRYWHTAVQVGEYIYAISGDGVSPPYYRDVLRGTLVGSGARQYAPNGAFTSRIVDLGRKYRLTWFEWTSTITPTDPGVGMALQFRVGNRPDLSDAKGSWSDLIPSERGGHVQTLVPAPSFSNFPYYPPIARYVQYRALFSTTTAYSDITPLLHEVRVAVEDTPDLVVSNLQISCDGCYGSLGVVSKTITVEVTVLNQGKDVPVGNNFFAGLFITTTGDYEPLPPDWPASPKFLPGSHFWDLQGSWFPAEGQKPLTCTFSFTTPKNVYLYAYADYNDTSEAPDYDVGEADPGNNLTVLYVVVIDPNSASATQTAWYWATRTAIPPTSPIPTPKWRHVYLPVIQRRFHGQFYLPLITGSPGPVPLPPPQASARALTPGPHHPTPGRATPAPSQGP